MKRRWSGVRNGVLSALRGLGGCALALVASLTFGVSHAAAEVLLPAQDAGVPAFDDVPVLRNAGRIPSGGGLVIESFDADPIVRVTAQDAPDVELTGELSLLHGFFIWVADEPLLEGHYTVLLEGQFGLQSVAPIEVIAPIAAGQPQLVAEPSASLVTEGTERACCDVFINGELFAGSGSCFFQSLHDSIELSLGLTTPEGAAVLSQHLFSVRALELGADDDARYAPLSGLAPLRFEVQAERYCYSVEAVDVVRGTTYAYDDLEACAEHGGFPDLETKSVEPTASALEALACNAPPVAHQAAWCTVNEPCADHVRVVNVPHPCDLHDYVCEGASLPGFEDRFFGAPALDAGVNAGVDAGQLDAGEPAPGDARVDETADASAPIEKESSGCSAVPGARSTSAPAGFALACVLLLIGMRRRARALVLAIAVSGCALGNETSGASGPVFIGSGVAGMAGGFGFAAGTGPIGGAGGVGGFANIPEIPSGLSIPTDGAVPIGVFVKIPLVTVTDAGFQVVDGQLHDVAGYWVWRPNAALALGLLVGEVRVGDGSGEGVTGTFSFSHEVVPAFPRSPPELISEPAASLHSAPASTACCRSWDGQDFQQSTCHVTSYQDRVLLGVGLSSPAAQLNLSQHLFALYRSTSSGRERVSTSLWQGWTELFFEESAESYCYEVEAIEMQSGSVTRYDDLEPRCALHGDLPPLTRHDAELSKAALHRSGCPAPPVGFEIGWCLTNLEECEAEDDSMCGLAGYVCRGDDPPAHQPVPPFGPGSRAEGNLDNVSGLVVLQDEDRVVVLQSAEAPSCSTTRARSGRGAGALLSLISALAWLRLRRRARGSSST